MSINSTHLGLWKGEGVTAQVLKSTDSQLLLTFCVPDTKELYTLFVLKGAEKELTSDMQQFNQAILQIRNLKNYETVKCSSATALGISFSLIFFLVILKLF